jgi:hypothetical protein
MKETKSENIMKTQAREMLGSELKHIQIGSTGCREGFIHLCQFMKKLILTS